MQTGVQVEASSVLSSRSAWTSRGSFLFTWTTRKRSSGSVTIRRGTRDRLGERCVNLEGTVCSDTQRQAKSNTWVRPNMAIKKGKSRVTSSTVNSMAMQSRCCCPWSSLPRGELLMTKSNNTYFRQLLTSAFRRWSTYVMVYSYSVHGVACLANAITSSSISPTCRFRGHKDIVL